MKVTINDIAKAANVSKSTVSKVINNSPTISDTTKRKVRQVMSEHNYIPSSIATQLAKQSSLSIGLIIDMSRREHFLNQFFYSIIGGIESVVANFNYDLTIVNIHSQRDNFLDRFVLSKKVEGIILDNTLLDTTMANQLLEHSFPFTVIGKMDGNSDVHWVDIDNELGGEMITKHLIEAGYQRIAFIGGFNEDTIFSQRFTGYRDMLQQYDIPFVDNYVKNGSGTTEFGYESAKELLSEEVKPDAFICASNYIAHGVLEAVKEANFAIPEQIGVATFDNYPLAPYMNPPLTCLDNDTFFLGEAAGNLLMNQIKKHTDQNYQHFIEPKLIVRESTRKV
ncbi:LacI family DNA-binding transcriptional regulator [Longirhabdus pacifica]|uniref:LacI family DNA-binding transcriptional regulator n=1 Tax=Longirhabdus pacifica TaxID=2305227 RepID=UPI00100889BF|nr:LacI family DNA-binding transcriptional regulator [Longirhabdus pacifica]